MTDHKAALETVIERIQNTNKSGDTVEVSGRAVYKAMIQAYGANS